MPSQSSPLVTLAVVPRERFSFSHRSLQAIYERTRLPFEMVYVDGGSPGYVRRFLRRASQELGFRLLRRWQYLSPNQARNLALRHVRTPYVVFLDNDVLVYPDWLQSLLDCAEREAADLVGPLCCCYEPEGKIVHSAGGVARLVEREGRRRLLFEKFLCGKLVDEIRDQLECHATELLSFHCLLARTDVLRRLGPLDERLLSAAQDLDLCLTAQRQGCRLMVEPKALVTHVPPPPFEHGDAAFFRRRWSPVWNRRSLEWFRRKWSLEDQDWGLNQLAHWLRTHQRLLPERPPVLERLARVAPAAWMERWIESSLGRRSPALLRSHASVDLTE